MWGNYRIGHISQIFSTKMMERAPKKMKESEMNEKEADDSLKIDYGRIHK